MFDHFKQTTHLSVNTQFLENEKAIKLAQFIRSHGKVQILEVKSNNIDEGFTELFESLERCPIRTIVAEFNNLGHSSDSIRQLARLIESSHKLQYLDLSSNKLENKDLEALASSIAGSGSLKLLEMKFNTSISTQGVKKLLDELKRKNNKVLLFVDFASSKIDKNVSAQLEEILKANRKINPISKQELKNNGLKENRSGEGNSYLPQNSRMAGGGLNNTYTNSFYGGIGKGDAAELTSQNLVRHLQNLLDQGRRQTAQTKLRLEQQLEELQRREKFNAKEVIDLDTNCNQLTLFNRNLKFELDRCLSEQQQIERQHSFQIRGYEEKVREASKELSELQTRYEQADQKMDKEHVLRMKELAREWDNRLRALEDKIRMTEIENNQFQNDIRKCVERRERVRIQIVNEEENLIQRIEDEETNRYNLRLKALQSKLAEIQESRQLYLKRNNDLINQMETMEGKNNEEILNLESDIEQLKSKEEMFLQNNRQFIATNQKLTSDIKMKELTFEKLEAEINNLNDQIELKKKFNKEQVNKIMEEQLYEKSKYQQDKERQMEKLSNLEQIYRASQIENAKLRQEYIKLSETVRINVDKSIEHVFVTNNLY